MESTVLKIIVYEGVLGLKILRFGSLSEIKISSTLLKSAKYSGVLVDKIKNNFSISETDNSEAPGQLLKHYCPNLETYLICKNVKNIKLEDNEELLPTKALNSAILIDFA
jgi:hypothetical protein